MEQIHQALKSYRPLVDDSLKAAISSGGHVVERRGIFSTAVVIWLMILQRLNPDHSLSAAVEQLRSGLLDDLLETGSLPARVQRISGHTGGLARGRERISLDLVEQTADKINEELEKRHCSTKESEPRVYVIDGSTIRTAHTPENVEAYSQYHNQHGKAHFPLIRVCVVTNAVTGIALRPAYGPYSGKKATDELTLAEELFPRIHPGSTLIGDRYYGCSRFAHMASQHGHTVITRVKGINAKKFIGVPKNSSGELAVEWESKQSVTGDSYSVSGRFIWHTITRNGFRPIQLILFTTSKLPLNKIVELYLLRWNVELDLRDIKSTLKMDMLYSKTPAMNAKELVLGITAYNLTRHIVVATAKSLKITPRSVSFSRVLKRMHAIASVVFDTGLSARSEKAFSYLILDLKSLKLPQRTKQRVCEPRKVWPKGKVSFMSKSRLAERENLKK